MRFKQVVAEFIGTMVLVIFGCGTAMLTQNRDTGYLMTALAFGLTIVAMAYSIGNVSGCHINPAVSLAMLFRGKINFSQFVDYVIAQCIGAIVGAGILAVVFKLGGLPTNAFGTNSLTSLNGSALAGLIVEIILTFVFIIAILGVTSNKAKHGSFSGLVIGLTLTLVHILGIGLTGTSVNPARSLGPALVYAISGNMEAMSCIWVFILGPFIGAALAVFAYTYIAGQDNK